MAVAHPEGGVADVALADAALTDAPLLESSALDTALPDTALPDAALPDATPPDAAAAPWHLPDYSCRVRVEIQNQELSAPLTDFTTLVALDAASLSCGIVPFDPLDLVFVDADGAVLNHELEPAPQSAPTPAWVRLPRIPPAPAEAHLWLYFSNIQSGSSAPPSLAWGPAFRGVWHLAEIIEPYSVVHDSTSYAHDATPDGLMDASSLSPGLIGHALGFDGLNDRLVIGDPSDGSLDFEAHTSFTYSLSVYPDGSAGQHDMPWQKGGSSDSNPGYDLELGSGCWGVGLSNGAPGEYHILCFGEESDFTPGWINLAVVVDRTSSEVNVYVNGVQESWVSLTPGYDVNTHVEASIGAEPYGFYAYRGLIDEVRVVAAARSAEWIAAEERSLRGELALLGQVESGG